MLSPARVVIEDAEDAEDVEDREDVEDAEDAGDVEDGNGETMGWHGTVARCPRRMSSTVLDVVHVLSVLYVLSPQSSASSHLRPHRPPCWFSVASIGRVALQAG